MVLKHIGASALRMAFSIVKTALKGKASASHTHSEYATLRIESANLAPGSWSGSAAPYTQTVAVTGILADETKQGIFPTPSEAGQAAWYESMIRCTDQAAGSLTFGCFGDKPTVNVPILVVVLEKK